MFNREKKERYEPTSEMEGKTKAYREVFDWVSTFAQALFGVVIVFTFLIRFVTVDGTSMAQTLDHGDRLIITDLNYTPKRGDIVVVHDSEQRLFSGPIIKRVIATAGEKVIVDYPAKTITVTDVYGNSYVLDEPYINKDECTTGYGTNEHCNHGWPHPANYMIVSEQDMKDLIIEFDVGEGEVFVCGDNRAHSLDSRYVGVIDERKILGKVLVRVFPNPKIMNHQDYTVSDGKLVAE